MGLRELLILVLILAIVAVILRGLYVALKARRGQLRMQLDKNIPQYDPDELLLSELPNGGARMVERSFAEVVKQNSELSARDRVRFGKAEQAIPVLMDTVSGDEGEQNSQNAPRSSIASAREAARQRHLKGPQTLKPVHRPIDRMAAQASAGSAASLSQGTHAENADGAYDEDRYRDPDESVSYEAPTHDADYEENEPSDAYDEPADPRRYDAVDADDDLSDEDDFDEDEDFDDEEDFDDVAEEEASHAPLDDDDAYDEGYADDDFEDDDDFDDDEDFDDEEELTEAERDAAYREEDDDDAPDSWEDEDDAQDEEADIEAEEFDDVYAEDDDVLMAEHARDDDDDDDQAWDEEADEPAPTPVSGPRRWLKWAGDKLSGMSAGSDEPVRERDFHGQMREEPVLSLDPVAERPKAPARQEKKTSPSRKPAPLDKSRQAQLSFDDELLGEPEPKQEAPAAPAPKAPRSKTREEADKQAEKEANAVQEYSEVLVINVVAKPDREFTGVELLPALLSSGLRFGEMSIFHKHIDNTPDSPVLFSVANMLNPGTFDLNQINDFATRGVCFFMTLPNVANSMQAFDRMLDAAQQLRIALDGDIKDDMRSVMTAQTIEHYRQRVRDFDLRQLRHHK